MEHSTADGLVLAGSRIHPGLGADWFALQLEHDVAQFRRLLRSSRPALVVVCSPPATAADIEAVAHQRRRRHDMRAVLIDSPGAAAERLGALRAGFDEAIDERIEPAELTGRLLLLADQARKAHVERPITIAAGLVLDIDSREVRVDGEAVHLRPREFALLEVFARNPGRTFTREQLLEAVGAPAALHDLRTVDVHIRWLREKLERDVRLPARLVTVRGIGYRLERYRPPSAVSVNRTLTDRQSTVDESAQD